MAERVRAFGQTHSMELIFFPLIILILVGLIANTFQSSAIQTVPVLPTPYCTGNIEPGECYPTNVNGCDSNATQNCNFTASTKYSFFNANSPFTLLLQGNIIGFMSSALNQGENNNIIKSGYTICIPTNSTGNYVNQTGSNINHFECLGTSTQGGNVSVPAQFSQTGIPMNATSNGGNNSQWNIIGCKLVKANYPCQLTNTRTNPGSSFQSWFGNTIIGASSTNFNSQMGFYGIYVKNGTTLTGTAGCTIYFSVSACRNLMPWLFYQFPTFKCPSTASVYNININKTTYYCLLPTVNQNTSTTSLPNSFSALSFLFGVVLFFAGLGISLTAATIGFTIDGQGTKLAQVFGLGILVWSFVFGEFGSWLTALPFNLGDIGFVTFTIMFFMGLYWRLFTLD